jgi:hypothetical protein
MVAGFVLSCAASAAVFLAVASPRFAADEKVARELAMDLDRTRSDLRAEESSNHDALAARDHDNDALRAENLRLESALAAIKLAPTKPPSVAPPKLAPAPKHEHCANPHDPLCGDLDAH